MTGHPLCHFVEGIGEHITQLRSLPVDDAYIRPPGQTSLQNKFFPNMPSVFSHPYYLDESTLILWGIRRNFSFLLHFLLKSM